MKNYFTKANIFRGMQFIVGITLTALGMSLIVKCNLGQGTLAGFASNISILSKLRYGTALAYINYTFFAAELLILRKNFKLFQLTQLFATVLFTSLVNLFLYDFHPIANLNIVFYPVQMISLLLAILTLALGMSLYMTADLFYTPFEGFCQVLHNVYTIPFGTIRRYADFCLVAMSLTLVLIYKIPNTAVREGTLISAVLLGTFINYFNKYLFPKKIVK